MPEKITVDTSRIVQHGILARNGVSGRTYALDGSQGDAWVGQDLTNKFVQDIFLSDEARQWRDSHDDNSVSGINTRLERLESQSRTIEDLNGLVATLQSESVADRETIEKLSAQLNVPVAPPAEPSEPAKPADKGPSLVVKLLAWLARKTKQDVKT